MNCEDDCFIGKWENSLELTLCQCAQPGVEGTAIPEGDQEWDHLGSTCETCQAPGGCGEQAQAGVEASPRVSWQAGIKPRERRTRTRHTKTPRPQNPALGSDPGTGVGVHTRSENGGIWRNPLCLGDVRAVKERKEYPFLQPS